jgi:hypothetical protein
MSEKYHLMSKPNDQDATKDKEYGSNNNNTAKIKELQGEVNTVINITKDNIDKAFERDYNLNELEDKTENLKVGASRFEIQSKKLKWSMCRKNASFWLILLLVLGVFLIIIIIVATQHSKHK